MRNLPIALITFLIMGCSSGNQNVQEANNVAVDSSSLDTGANTPLSDSTDQETDAGQSLAAFDELRMGMTEEELIALMGEPTNKETIGNDPKVVMEDWWYGDNQKVRMVGRKVNHVVKDVARQKDLLQQLMAAKKNNNEEEAKRIMEELTKDHK